MSEFAVGDRVRWHFAEHGERRGTVTSTRDCYAFITEDDADGVGCINQVHLTRIEEPQPWQGDWFAKCAQCLTPLTVSTACILTPTRQQRPCYVCRPCWDMFWRMPPHRVKREDGVMVDEQQDALATSRAWMRERHPDDPRWQEAE